MDRPMCHRTLDMPHTGLTPPSNMAATEVTMYPILPLNISLTRVVRRKSKWQPHLP